MIPRWKASNENENYYNYFHTNDQQHYLRVNETQASNNMSKIYLPFINAHENDENKYYNIRETKLTILLHIMITYYRYNFVV